MSENPDTASKAMSFAEREAESAFQNILTGVSNPKIKEILQMIRDVAEDKLEKLTEGITDQKELDAFLSSKDDDIAVTMKALDDVEYVELQTAFANIQSDKYANRITDWGLHAGNAKYYRREQPEQHDAGKKS